MVDGDLLANYPIQIFDSSRYINPSSGHNIYQLKNQFTPGLLLDKPEQFGYDKPGNYPLNIIQTLIDYIVQFIKQ